MVALGGVGVALALRADRLGVLVAALGGGAVLLLVLAVARRRSRLAPWAYALMGAAYATFLFIQGQSIDGLAPIYAANLLLSAELAFWAIERPVPDAGQGLAARRVSLVVAATLVGGGVAGLILTASELSFHGGLALEVLGVAAAVGAFVLLARLARPQGGR